MSREAIFAICIMMTIAFVTFANINIDFSFLGNAFSYFGNGLPRVGSTVNLTHSTPNSSKELLEKLSELCVCDGPGLCARCGIESCWNLTNRSISENCFILFESSASFGMIRKFKKGRRQKIFVDAQSFDAVLDFHNDNKRAGAVYHNLIDCFFYQLALIPRLLEFLNGKASQQSRRRIAVVAEPSMIRFMELVCRYLEGRGIEPVIFSSVDHLDYDSECLNRHHNSSVGLALSGRYESWFILRTKKYKAGREALVVLKKLFSALIYEHFPARPAGAKCSTVVLILRNPAGARGFVDEADLVAAFRSRFGDGGVALFRGNETFAQTAATFRSACAVVGYHGAGSVNIFLAPPGTLCLEVTTLQGAFNDTARRFVSSSDWAPWRTNRGIVDGLDYPWQVKLVEHHHLWPLRVPQKGLENSGTHIIREARVLLTREHIDDLLWRVEAFLQGRSTALAPAPAAPREDVTVPFSLPARKLGYD